MYKMKADGVVFYDPSSDDMALHVLNPKAKYELNKVDSLTFKMFPGNVMYSGLQKMKTLITLEQDGVEIFRGRVLETTTDMYNQKEVYCEGELSYLLDSLVRPYEYEGKTADLFRQLVEGHNEQVDENKRFEVGIISALGDADESKTQSDAYTDTLTEIRQMMISRHDGYLRIRMENGVRYLDYIDEYDDECGQAIEFGVNMVDIENRMDAGDVFSVLVPLGGYNTKYKYPLTIESVNDGKDYIEDEEAIAKYGRIVKTFKWEELTEPQDILEKGRLQFAKMKANRTLTIKAVDFHVIDAGVDCIRLGKRVKLTSVPHGLDETEICSKIVLDVEAPEKTEYTFGLPPETLTDNNASTSKKITSNANHVHKWLIETDTSFEVFVDETNGKILLQADNIKANAQNIQTNAQNIQTNAQNIQTNASKIEVVSDDLLVVSEDVKVWGEQIEAAAQDIVVHATRLDAMADVIGLEARASGNDDETEYVAVRLDGIEGTLEQHATTVQTNAQNIQTNAQNIKTNADDVKTNASKIEVLSDRLNVCVEDLNTYAESVEVYAQDVSTIADTVSVQAETIKEKADRIELEGYVKATELETEVLTVIEGAVIDSIHAQSLGVDGNSSFHGTIDAGGDVIVGGTVDTVNVDAVKVDADVAEVGAMTCETLNGETPKWTGGTVLTGIGTISQSKRFLNIMLADGSTAQIDIVTDVSISPSTAYINYLGKE